MHRFFTSRKYVTADRIKISDRQEAHHIKDVLRIKEETEVIVFDEEGNEYRCLVKSLGRGIDLAIKERHPAGRSSQRLRIAMACAIPKQSKMDTIVDKLTQLGVDRIIPLVSERVVVRLDSQGGQAKLRRWTKIALAAAKQSQRNQLPCIDPVSNMEQAVSQSKGYELRLIPTLTGGRHPTLKESCSAKRPNGVFILIGPEGDFTTEELALARKAGFLPVSLGDLVLRVDTAAVAVASFLRLLFL